MTVGNTEPEVEVKRLEEFVAEEVALNHPKRVDGFVADAELHSAGVTTRANESQSMHSLNQSVDQLR